MSSHHYEQMPQRSQVSGITLRRCSQNVFVFVIVFVFAFVFVNFFGHVISSHHSEQISQMSQVSRVALRRCSLNVFVFVMFFVFVFVFVIFLVMSCLLITLNKCLKGHKSLELLLGGVLKMSLSLSLYLSLSIFFGHVMSSHHSEQMSQRSQVSRIALRRCSQWLQVFRIALCMAKVKVS